MCVCIYFLFIFLKNYSRTFFFLPFGRVVEVCWLAGWDVADGGRLVCDV